MPVPRIFISSTCYDLKYIRENLKYFVRSLGYEPTLSEDGAVFYDPAMSVQDACLVEVPACQMFILIIGGRYGGRYKKTDNSITNAEYSEAVKAKIPVFALVDKSVYSEYQVYRSNKNNNNIDERKIAYPAIDDTKIFDFIEQVQEQTVNNALVPFSDFEEMRRYLKQQWAAMFHRFLTSESNADRITDLFKAISTATDKVEFITRRIVSSIAKPKEKLEVELYDLVVKWKLYNVLVDMNIPIGANEILQSKTMEEHMRSVTESGREIAVLFDSEIIDDYTLVSETEAGFIGGDLYNRLSSEWIELRKDILFILKSNGVTPDEFLK